MAVRNGSHLAAVNCPLVCSREYTTHATATTTTTVIAVMTRLRARARGPGESKRTEA